MSRNSEVESNYHLGQMIYDSFREKPNYIICQIEASTGKSETYDSVLNRSCRLAKCFRHAGLKVGDVLALGGRNHLDLHIPFYAALMCGLPIAGIDPLHKFDEIKKSFKLTKPKIAFCQNDAFEATVQAARELGLDTQVVTFDEGKCSFREFLKTYEDKHDDEEFRPTDFDGDKVFAFLIGTSGTTGGVKFAAFHHTQMVKLFKATREPSYVRGSSLNVLNLSPVQWITGYFFAAFTPVCGGTKIQTIAPSTADHIIDMINKYKPTLTFISPALAAQILNSSKECDWTCFNRINIVGSKVSLRLLVSLMEKVGENCTVEEQYGQTETIGICTFQSNEGPLGNCGRPLPSIEFKLLDPKSGQEIKEPYQPGELLIRGRRMVEYYNMPEETKNCFTADGFYKSGDLLYRDENNFLYFVDRLKMLIKYKNYHISPLELEQLLLQHDGISDVAVTSIPDEENGELPLACVVRSPGSRITAQEVKDVIGSQLSDTKQLRGGVVFLDSLPTTSTEKIARGQLQQMVQTAQRE